MQEKFPPNALHNMTVFKIMLGTRPTQWRAGLGNGESICNAGRYTRRSETMSYNRFIVLSSDSVLSSWSKCVIRYRNVFRNRGTH